MIATMVLFSLAWAWLMYETKGLTIRLLVGVEKPKRNPWLDKQLICNACGECHHRDKERFLFYKIPARTIKAWGSTLNFNEGCNYQRTRLLKDIASLQKRKSTVSLISRKPSYGYEYGNGELELFINGKPKAKFNGNYKRGMIKQAMRG